MVIGKNPMKDPVDVKMEGMLVSGLLTRHLLTVLIVLSIIPGARISKYSPLLYY